MIGREKEKKELVDDILRGEHRLIILHAPTGYGKERLAVETAYELIDNHHYTCIYVDSHGILSIEDLAIKILTTFGILAPPSYEKEKLQEIFKTVNRKCLLILDNFDHAFHGGDTRKDTMGSRSRVANEIGFTARKPTRSSVPNTFAVIQDHLVLILLVRHPVFHPAFLEHQRAHDIFLNVCHTRMTLFPLEVVTVAILVIKVSSKLTRRRLQRRTIKCSLGIY